MAEKMRQMLARQEKNLKSRRCKREQKDAEDRIMGLTRKKIKGSIKKKSVLKCLKESVI